MIFRSLLLVCLSVFATAMFAAALPVAAQDDIDLEATQRVLPSVGAGVVAVRRDAAGRYYVLSERGGAVQVFDEKGKPLALIPSAP